jgi:predicted Ser/Thr protein kinase
MASLAHAIQTYQSGSLSSNEFFAQVDNALASDQRNSERLREFLSDEHTKVFLPPEVYAELQQRVEHFTDAKHGARYDETHVQIPLQTRTAIAPPPPQNSAHSTHPSYPSHSSYSSHPSFPPYVAGDDERVKGVGDTLNGRFVLEECIGFGGMGTVYKALDLRKLEASDRNPYIAIKVLNVQFRGHPKSLIALQREAKKAQSLAHPNIVTVYDFDRDGSTVFLTMEYLSGNPLSRILRAPDFTGMPYAETLRILRGMARALSYAHERGFVHCDLKPANVFLTDTGEVKVIDFGIARVFRKPEKDVDATVFDPGSLGGLTPAYASPEMLEHRVPDPRDDVYALACIVYELLTGKHPFDRATATQARNNGIRPQRPKKLDYRQWRALRAALAFEREARMPTVDRFLEEMSGGSRAKMAMTVAASCMLLLALAIAAWTFYREFAGQETPAVADTPLPTAPASDERRAVTPAPTLTLSAVTPVLDGVSCSALAASVQGQDVHVQGYLAQNVGADRLKEMLRAIPGVASVKADGLHELAADKCAVVKTFAPFWKSNRLAGSGASIRTRAANAELREGEPLIVDIRTPSYDSYIYVDYFALDGGVAHLAPNVRARGNQAPPGYEAVIGSLGNWVISKPFGAELIVLIATPAPLFDGLRPDHESAADYLKALDARLAQMASKYGADRIAADFVQIRTRPR